MDKCEGGAGALEILSLARNAVESYVLYKEVLDKEEYVKGPLKRKGGVFVSLKKDGQLRGCIGTIKPTCPTLAEEIISNAISAASKDPRFPPVKKEELKDLSYSVDVMGELMIVSKEDLDPTHYGVLVEKGNRRGLLLPDLKDVQTIEEQLLIACHKAGITSMEGISIYRFTVERFRE